MAAAEKLENARAKALMDHLNDHNENGQDESAEGRAIQTGFLIVKKCPVTSKKWQRRYFSVQGGALHMTIRDDKERLVRPVISDLRLCTTRLGAQGTDRQFCFECVTPSMSVSSFTAPSTALGGGKKRASVKRPFGH